MSSIKVPTHIERIEPYVPGKPIEEVERELGLRHTIKLASNENPLGPSPRAVEAARRALADVHRYPDGSGYYLRRELAELHSLPIEQVMLGNGSTDLVEILARTFLGQDGAAVMSDQTFIMYRIAVMAVNGNARVVPLCGMRNDLEAMAAAMDATTRIVYVANPNNPTGTYVTRREMERFMERVPAEVLIVLDEAYREYVQEPDYADGLTWLGQGRRLAVLRTFSKIHGLAGLRIGYALTTAEIREAAEKVRSPFNTSSVAQAAGIAALHDREHVDRSRRHNTAELEFLYQELGRRGVGFTRSAANFVLVDTGRSGETLFTSLLRRGVIVRPMGAYHLPTSIRVTVGTREENLSFLEALDQSLRD